MNLDIYQREEDLHPDLIGCVENSSFGKCIKHPLVFSLFHVPQLNAFVNEQYKHKKKACEQSLLEKDYSQFIWFHERPFRLTKFIEIVDLLSDEEYWELLGKIWTDSENLWQYGSVLGYLLNSPRQEREKMMDEDEQKLLASLPDQFTVYRGHQFRNRLGYSWTLSYHKAKWFADRFNPKRKGVITATINKKDIIAVLLGRGEFEVVCHPDHLKIKKIAKTKRPKWIEDILVEAQSKFVLKNSAHDLQHWEKVEKNALSLVKFTSADKLVVQLFAILHDCCRINEYEDPEHGFRAAKFADELYSKNKLQISPYQLKILKEACQFHNDGQISSDSTIGTCWDADRLDLLRVGIIPDPKLLSTQAGKDAIWK